MSLAFNPDEGSRGGGGAPYTPPVGKSTIVGSPGLLTSTGGLNGGTPLVLMPLADQVFGKTYLALIDPSDNDCEEEAVYFFKQEDVQINRKVSIHKLIITYREIDQARFNIGVSVYIEETDSFKIITKPVVIAPMAGRKLPFPSNTLRSKKISLVIAGERPQPFLTRKANSGGFAITRVLMVGKADEQDQL